MKREDTRDRLCARDTYGCRELGARNYSIHDFTFDIVLTRMERLISIRRKSDDWFFDRFLQISSDLRITFTRFVQTRVMRVFAYNALMIYRDLVLTGFFHSRFSTKMFCYCFIIMENIWSKTWHENINMLFVLNVLLSIRSNDDSWNVFYL